MDTKQFLHQCQLINQHSGKRITILGAGIAGLVAAYELERLGHQVDLMEGSPRIGGRVWTHRFAQEPGAPYSELGAMRIPGDHQHVLHYVHELGLSDKLRKFVTVFEESNALMNIQGTVFRIKDAPRILQQRYQGIFQDPHYSEKTRLFATWLKTIVDTIAPSNLRESLDRDLESHLMDDLERLDLEPYFNQDGQTIDLHRFLKENFGFRARCSQALDVFFSDILIETSHDLLQLEGGMDQIIDRLVASIKAPIHCNQEIVSLEVQEQGVAVSWLEDGQRYTHHCDYVVCTIPFSVLRNIELVGFDDTKLATIHNTIYCPATKVAFHCAQPFWEKDGIKGGASFSGDSVRQTYYPSVTFNPTQGSTLLASYTIGDDAERMGHLSESERYAHVQKVVSKIHPEIANPGMLVGAATIAWGNYKWSAGGCTIDWDDERANPFETPVRYLEAARPQKTLFFAGEHCSRFPAWLQGSIESALEAVRSIAADQSLTSSTTCPVRFDSGFLAFSHPKAVSRATF
jgi:monoamine oxidase